MKKILICLVASLAIATQAQLFPEDPVIYPVNDLRGSLSRDSIALTWTDRSSGESHYEVDVLVKWKNVSSPLARYYIPDNSTGFVFSPIERRTEYVFRVRPVLGPGVTTAFSNVVTVKVK